MIKKTTFFLFLASSLSFAQSITVDDISFSEADLANLLLSGSCIDPTNISRSSAQSVGYFNQNGSTFPLAEGVIIRTGNISQTEGIYTNTNLSSQDNSNSDPDLQTISNDTGQSLVITDTAFLQFDFIPISSDFNFDFVFASNEYGQYQCGFSDVFAFLLTDISTGITINLAVLPATTTPVSVLTIRDNTYNSGCTSENPNLFSTYNVNNPALSTLNMRGHTEVLNANSTLISDGRTYRIRMVIGDYGNPDYDSAVLIDAGNFITPLDIGDDASLCLGDSMDVTTNLDAIEYTHIWTLDSIPLTETSNTLTITQAGTYVVTATKNGCEITDTIIISDLSISSPIDIPACDDGSGTFSYDLSINNETIIGIDNATYDIHYFANQADIPNNPITAPDIINYLSSGNETIYIKIYNTITNSYCDAELPFNLTVDQAINATEPNDVQLCNISDPVNTTLTDIDNEILGALNPLNYSVTYYSSAADAQNNQNPIGPNYNISIANSPQTVWAVVQSNSNTNCFDSVSFDVIVNPLPPVSEIDDVIECNNYTLPAITNGVYYDGPNGTGTMLNEGDVIDEGGTYYIYNGPDANGCFNQSSFNLEFVDEYGVQLFHCGEFSVPTLPPGNFYTETDGPNGTGTIINPTTIFTSTDLPLTVHYYAETINPLTGLPFVCRNEAFDITIYDVPPVDTLTDVVTCVDYTLEVLTDGAYYSGSGGSGTAYNAGDSITTSGTYYIYNTETHNLGTADEIICDNESTFEIDIINNPGNDTICGSYILPDLEEGGYFSAPGGTGTAYPFGFEVTTTTDIYIYAETSTAPNCTTNLMFTITIVPIPPIDILPDVINCENDPYIIQPIPNGDYYADDGGGNIDLTNPISVGSSISTIGDNIIHIYNSVNGCSSQSSFTIEIRELPLIDNFTDVFVCDPYELPALTDGSYYTEPGGNGDNISEGYLVETTQTFYIYNTWDDITTCSNETIFTVYMEGVDVGEFEDVNECDSYLLPDLTVGSYYRQPNGVDEILPADYLFTTATPGNPHTIYVYHENGDRIICTDEASFIVTLSETPTLPNFQNQVTCGNYVLPVLDNSSYDLNYYSSPNGTDLITNLDISTPGDYTIYVYAAAFGNTDCFDETSFDITIHPLLDLDIEGGIICVDPITNETLQPVLLESNLNPSAYIIEWYFGGALVHTGTNYLAEDAGTYTVTTTLINPITPPQPSDCDYESTDVTVTASSAAIASYSVTEDFVDNAVITVTITGGLGEYLYQLDNGPFQNSNEFTNVTSGDHIITIIDTLGGCSVLLLEVTVIKYPKFFTPNNDGVNDTWNIRDLSDQPDAIIQVFDRFGKFITQMSPTDRGWDGTYNGRNLFASDYWFSITYKGRNNEDKEFKAHFSLKR